MNHLIRLSLLMTFLLAAVSCKENPRAVSRLDEAEAMIADMPDSALAILRQHKDYRLNTRSLKARHALLHTIALDKNYIDLTTDSIIAPAVKYYDHKGTSDDRFKTLFYLGRIRQNAGDKEAAMDCFIRATDLASEVTDTSALARCYAAQGVIYADFYDYPNAIEANRKAAELFLAVGNVNSYVNNQLKIADNFWALGYLNEAKKHIDLIETYKYFVKPDLLNSYFSLKLKCEMDFGKKYEITLEEYINTVCEYHIDWNIVSIAYCNINQYDKAMEAILNYRKYNTSISDEHTYYAIMSQLYEYTQSYKEATEAYKAYIEILDSTYIDTHTRNIQYIEERYEQNMTILEEKNKNLILFLVLFAVCALLFFCVILIIKQVKDTRLLRNLYSSALEERKSLERILEEYPSTDAEINQILSERMELLNEIVLNHRLSHSGKSEDMKRKINDLLNDTKEYLSTIGMTYVVKNPDVVSFLKSKGLTTWEIGYCCLYVMGYNAKEISGIMQNNQVYKISSEIRKKLGLEGGKIRLETYLKDLFAKG